MLVVSFFQNQKLLLPIHVYNTHNVMPFYSVIKLRKTNVLERKYLRTFCVLSESKPDHHLKKYIDGFLIFLGIDKKTE